jgi:hypothetical protein
VDSGLVRTVSIVNQFALDLQAPAMLAVKTEPGKVDQVAKDMAHLTNLVTRQIQCIPGVRSTETLMIANIRKLSYRWSPVFEGEELD